MSPEIAEESEKTKIEEHDEESVIDTSKMSEGKRAALELAEASRETTWEHGSFVAEMFMGRFPFERIFPYPQQSPEDKKKGDEFLEKLETLLKEKTDPDAIDREGEIPQEVLDELATLGAFGIKIPTEYGGLGLSQVNYSRAAIKLGSWCGNLTALLSAHQSIGIPQPLKEFGTPEQKKKYLPRVAAGEISAFALTEDAVGSDPAKMTTLAEPTEDGEHFLINGKKLWCTNGTKAGLIVVMAKTPDKVIKGRKKSMITAFIVEADSPGITITHRCHFLGLKSLYNAVIEFKDVKVPRENIIYDEGRGLKVALTTLNTGRLTLPAGVTGASKRCIEIAREWANERVQWGAKIGYHAAIADKIANMTSTTFAMEAMTLLASGLVDRGDADIRLEASMCKLFGSEEAWKIVDETMQIRGGRGYETADSLKARGEKPIPIERMMRDCRINRIFEGSTEIMYLFIAREALDPHLKVAAEVLNSKLPMKKRLAAAGKTLKFYLKWYPTTLLPDKIVGVEKMNRRLASHVYYASEQSGKLARSLFHAMAKYGPKLEREQMVLSRLVNVGTDLFAISATCSRAQMLLDQGVDKKKILPLVDHFCRGAKLRIKENYRGLKHNRDKRGYKLARRVLDNELLWVEDGKVD